MTQATRATITGRVQGVGFRAFTRDTAHELGVTGWVRNREDGAVEAHLEGDGETVEAMLGRLRQGPRAGSVTDLDARAAEAEGRSGFEIVT